MSTVRSTNTTPTVADFGNSNGTPIVVDRVAAKAYILKSDDTVAEISGSGGGAWDFDEGGVSPSYGLGTVDLDGGNA